MTNIEIIREKPHLEEIKYKEAKKLAETHSCQSHRSRRSNATCSSSTTSSAATVLCKSNANVIRLISRIFDDN